MTSRNAGRGWGGVSIDFAKAEEKEFGEYDQIL
jgi:hypothetical protein